MKKGKIISLALNHKNGRSILRTGNSVTEADVNNFDDLVKNGHIESEDQEIDLSKLKKDQLQEKCIELDIDYKESASKSELIDLIDKAAKPE